MIPEGNIEPPYKNLQSIKKTAKKRERTGKTWTRPAFIRGLSEKDGFTQAQRGYDGEENGALNRGKGGSER